MRKVTHIGKTNRGPSVSQKNTCKRPLRMPMIPHGEGDQWERGNLWISLGKVGRKGPSGTRVRIVYSSESMNIPAW